MLDARKKEAKYVDILVVGKIREHRTSQTTSRANQQDVPLNNRHGVYRTLERMNLRRQDHTSGAPRLT